VIDIMLERVVGELNSYMNLRAPALTRERVVSESLFDTHGVAREAARNRLVACLVSIEENRVYRSMETHQVRRDGMHERIKPKVRLNLYILFIANHDQYSEALKAVSHVIAFFQQHGATELIAEDEERSRVIFELYSTTFEQQNHVWASLGAKYMPSVMYRASIVDIRDRKSEGEIPPVREIVTES
jgi:hypothetical protein